MCGFSSERRFFSLWFLNRLWNWCHVLNVAIWNTMAWKIADDIHLHTKMEEVPVDKWGPCSIYSLQWRQHIFFIWKYICSNSNNKKTTQKQFIIGDELLKLPHMNWSAFNCLTRENNPVELLSIISCTYWLYFIMCLTSKRKFRWFFSGIHLITSLTISMMLDSVGPGKHRLYYIDN